MSPQLRAVARHVPYGVLDVRFVAQSGSKAGGVYDVRLVRPE